MKKSKQLSVLLTAAMLFITACSQGSSSSVASSQKPAESEPAFEERELLKMTTVFYNPRTYNLKEDNVLDHVLKDKFNIELEYTEVSSSEYQDRVVLLYASGDYPDIILNNTQTVAKILGNDGLLLPLNQKMDAIPNYKTIWDNEEDMDIALRATQNADGNNYFLPGKNVRIANSTWIYRAGTCEAWGLKFPNTPDELMEWGREVLKHDPDAIPLTAAGGAGIDGFAETISYTIYSNPIKTPTGTYIHPKTGEFVSYGAERDEFRQTLCLMHDLYKEGILNPELATYNNTQLTEAVAAGKIYMFYHAIGRAEWANTNSAAVDPNAGYIWSKEMICADDSNGIAYIPQSSYLDQGLSISVDTDEEKVDRILEFYDWLCTEEGSEHMCWGEEGVTYEVVNGERQMLPFICNNITNPNGEPSWLYTVYEMPDNHPRTSPSAFRGIGNGIYLMELADFLKSDPKLYTFPEVILTLTEEEETRMLDLASAVEEIRDEHIEKFVMGQADPHDDAQWKKYLSDLKAVGLEELKEIRTIGYERAYK